MIMEKIIFIVHCKTKEETNAVLKKAESEGYLCHSGISVFINTTTVDPERLYNE